MMKKLFTLLCIISSFAANAQYYVNFASSTGNDTARTNNNMLVAGIVRFALYGSADTTQVLGVTSNGQLVLRNLGIPHIDSALNNVIYNGGNPGNLNMTIGPLGTGSIYIGTSLDSPNTSSIKIDPVYGLHFPQVKWDSVGSRLPGDSLIVIAAQNLGGLSSRENQIYKVPLPDFHEQQSRNVLELFV